MPLGGFAWAPCLPSARAKEKEYPSNTTTTTPTPTATTALSFGTNLSDVRFLSFSPAGSGRPWRRRGRAARLSLESSDTDRRGQIEAERDKLRPPASTGSQASQIETARRARLSGQARRVAALCWPPGRIAGPGGGLDGKHEADGSREGCKPLAGPSAPSIMRAINVTFDKNE